MRYALALIALALLPAANKLSAQDSNTPHLHHQVTGTVPWVSGVPWQLNRHCATHRPSPNFHSW
jgi:hypothetical protein